MPRFIGRVFARTSERGGHQFCQHYLDGMFPLARDPVTGQLSRDPETRELVGCDEARNEFMESEIAVARDGDEGEIVQEGWGISWLSGARGTQVDLRAREVEIHDGSPVERRGGFSVRDGAARPVAKVKVKELSRLWLYRNGKSPSDQPPLLVADVSGAVRTATM
jgi:hypothetical protein